MTFRIEEPLPHVLPYRMLALLLAASVGIPWLMVPRQKELVERLLKDHQYGRVLAVIQKDPSDLTDSAGGALSQLTVAQLTRINDLLKLSPREQLRAIFAPQSALDYDPYVHTIVLAAIQFVDVVPPPEASEVILPHLDRVPENLRADLLGVIARNALAVNQPRIAALALEKACQSKDSDWPLAKNMVQSFQWSGEPGRAAAELDEWLRRRHALLSPQQLDAARTVQYQISLASGHPEWAFDTCLAVLKHEDPHAQMREWMKRALDAGLQSSRTRELIPFVRVYVATFPEARLDLSQLPKEARAAGQRFLEYKQWLTQLANWSDWESDFDTAFAAHLRLAAMGELPSLDRCVDLNEMVGRTEEMVQLLELVGTPTGREELKLHLAHMEADMGQNDKARKLLEEWLGAHHEHRDARFDYACLLEDLGDDAGCRKALEDLLARHPLDAPAMKRLAEVCIRGHDNARALQLFEKLPPSAHDHHTLESYSMIAESLGDQEARLRGLTLQASLEKKPKIEVYLDIANAASYLPDQQPAISALTQGLTLLPHSTSLRIALANCYEEAGRPDDALATLMNEECKQSFPAVQVLLSMAAWISDPARLLDFLGENLEKRFPLSVRQRLDLAVLNQQLGRQATSDRLWASVKEEARTYKVLAEVRLQTANYAEAMRLQMAHLQSHPTAAPSDWRVLGDIYEHLKRSDDAKQAYAHSLSLLTSDLDGTASN